MISLKVKITQGAQIVKRNRKEKKNLPRDKKKKIKQKKNVNE